MRKLVLPERTTRTVFGGSLINNGSGRIDCQQQTQNAAKQDETNLHRCSRETMEFLKLYTYTLLYILEREQFKDNRLRFIC